jgi:hypothetical protein
MNRIVNSTGLIDYKMLSSDHPWRFSEVSRIISENITLDSEFMRAPGTSGLGGPVRVMMDKIAHDVAQQLQPSRYFSDKYRKFLHEILTGAKPLIRRWGLALLQSMQTGWIAIETYGSRDASLFRLLFSGVYICDCIMPSLHFALQSWSKGGRGGLASGLYVLEPYRWKDKGGLPVWNLKGDSRRGAILLHSGNSVTDSKGCVLLGLAKGDAMFIADSRLATQVVWAMIRMSEINPSWYPSLPGLRKLPPMSFLILRDPMTYRN